MAKKTTAPAKKKATASKKFSFVDDVYEGIFGISEITKKGELKIKKSDLKKVLESTFENAAKASASGERIKFPFIGTLSRKDVEARKAEKRINPFTKEPMTVKARPATKKPRWTFPQTIKQLYANKKYW